MQTDSSNIEFKESWRYEYLKWICGFVNAQCGVQNAKKQIQNITNRVCNILGLLVDANLKEKNDKQYIEIITKAYPYLIKISWQVLPTE